MQAAADDFLSIEQVAAYTCFDRRTVEQWVEQGRYNERGRKVYLPAYEYSGQLRFKRGDVEAFGLGVGVLTPSTAAGQSPTPLKKSQRLRNPENQPLWRRTRRCGWLTTTPLTPFKSHRIMSFYLISIDTLMQLYIPTLTYVLSLFQRELDGTIATCVRIWRRAPTRK